MRKQKGVALVRELNWSVIFTALWIGLFVCSPVSAGQAASHSKAGTAGSGLTVEDIIKLTKAGLSEDIIIQQIRKNREAFDLSTEQLIALKAANVSDRIVEVMLDPSKAETPAHIAPAPVAAEPEVAEAALPTEVGVYAKKQGQWVEVSPEIVYWKTGGALKTIATAGIRHGDVNGHVPGANSHTSFGTPLEFLIVAPEGTALAEYQLVRLHPNKDNREFRTITGGILHSQSGSQRDQLPFDGKKIASRVYELTFPASAGPGEYGLLPPGSTSGSGKIYSFHVIE
ncbi:MAG: hypothetical protein WCD04_12480 [Terriglobia bacterium]|jgi:hypothetical protein